MKRSMVLLVCAAVLSCRAPAHEARVRARAVRPEVHGHRGARGLRPESTLASFEAAIELGVDRVELDLHLSADNELIVWHDSAISPEFCRYGGALATSDVAFSGRPVIRSLALAQLRAFECDVLQPQFSSQRAVRARYTERSFSIVTLGELFAFTERIAADERAPSAVRERARRVGFNIELKRGWPGDRASGDDMAFERAVLRVIDEHHARDRVIVQSFDEQTLRTVRALDGGIATSFLSNDGASVQRAAAVRASIWSPRAEVVTRENASEAHRAGLRVIVWTVNDERALRELLAMGIDGVITDRPDVILRALHRIPEPLARHELMLPSSTMTSRGSVVRGCAIGR
ncbi:MAG: glycerophosphodiester phosphodiesterase family protein [Polyangiales bacterium]